MEKSYIEAALSPGLPEEMAAKIIGTGLRNINETIDREVLGKYAAIDMPMVVAELEAVAQGIRAVTGEEANRIADSIKSRITVMSVDAAEFQKQIGEVTA